MNMGSGLKYLCFFHTVYLCLGMTCLKRKEFCQRDVDGFA